MRCSLSSADAHHRDWLGDRHWPAGHDRVADAGRLSAGARLTANADLSERLPVRTGGSGGDSSARATREAVGRARGPIPNSALALATSTGLRPSGVPE